MKEIRISYVNGVNPIIDVRDNGVSLEFEKIDSCDRWQIIEKLEECRKELIKIHRASW